MGGRIEEIGNLTGVKDMTHSMSWKIFGQPRRKKGSSFGLWGRRRTKKERKKNLLEKKKVAEDESRV